MNIRSRGFTLIEILIALVVLTVGVTALHKAFAAGLAVGGAAESMGLTAVHIAESRMEIVRDTAFGSLADVPAAEDPNFPGFDVEVEVEEGDDPMEVAVTVSWETPRGPNSLTLTTQVADI